MDNIDSPGAKPKGNRQNSRVDLSCQDGLNLCSAWVNWTSGGQAVISPGCVGEMREIA
jgi:hypothetical protein